VKSSRSFPLRAFAFAFALAVPAALAAPAAAEERADGLAGPRALGMGGAHVAVPNDNAALWYNPAGISYGQKYSIEAGYAYSFDLHSHVGFISVVDSKSSKVGGGLSVSYLNSRPIDPDTGDTLIRTGYDVRFALSYPISDRVFLGFENKLVTRRVDPRGVEEPKGDDLGPADFKKYALDVGVLVAIADGFTLGLAGRNLTLPKNPDMPTELRAGFGVGLGIFMATADYVADFTTISGKVAHSVHAGAEVFLFKALALRAGYELNGTEPDGMGGYDFGHWISGGAAYVSPTFAIDAGYKRKLTGGVAGDTGDTFAVALRFFL